MAKKRKTKKEKIILRLKRELEQQKTPFSPPKITKMKTAFAPSNEEKQASAAIEIGGVKEIKRDLAKSIFLSLVAIGCLFLLYLG